MPFGYNGESTLKAIKDHSGVYAPLLSSTSGFVSIESEALNNHFPGIAVIGRQRST
jgi:hypothetical protein